VIKYLRFTGKFIEIYISYAMKLQKLCTLKNDNIGPSNQKMKINKMLQVGKFIKLFKLHYRPCFCGGRGWGK
jgi:hypothetical protein